MHDSHQHRESMDQYEERKRQAEELERLASLRTQLATFDDLKRVTLRRSKIEEWVDEPFFQATMKEAFVKVGFSQKYLIAQVKATKDDSVNQYTLTNGKKTGIYLRLLMTEDTPDKLKWFKINQISNQEIG